MKKIIRAKLPIKSFCGINYGHNHWARHLNTCSICRVAYNELLEKQKNSKTKKIQKFNCPICKQEFKRINNVHLLKKHNLTIQQFEEIYPEFTRTESRANQIRKFENKKEYVDYVVCPICNNKFSELNNYHLYTHNLTAKQFDEMFPNNKRLSQKVLKKKNTLENLTQKQSENLKYGHTLQGFIDKYGIEKGKIKFDLSKKRKSLGHKKEWYIEKYGEKIGEKIYKDANEKRKNNLETFQKRHGIEKGKEEYFNYCKKLSKSYDYSVIRLKNYSKISQKLFWDIYNKITDNSNKKIYFAELNHEYSCGTKRLFDFVMVDNKKAIEFNGEAFHARYNDKSWRHVISKATADESQRYDREKMEAAMKNGYSVLTVWHSDYKNDPELILNKCLDFLDLGKADILEGLK